MDRLFRVNIYSWNAQGGFRRKAQYLDGMLSAYSPNILLIQEQGTGGTGFAMDENVRIGTETYRCILKMDDPTAVVQRCSIAIMVEEDFLPHVADKGWMIQQVQRPVGFVDLYCGIRIATMHAIANSSISVAETRQVLQELDTEMPNGKWLLMGDFNSCPQSYELRRSQTYTPIPNIENQIQYAGSESRNQQYCGLLYDAAPTQGARGNRENYLDFALAGDQHYFGMHGITNRMVTDFNGRYVSDHNLICVSLAV